jgi:hypothetical protein
VKQVKVLCGRIEVIVEDQITKQNYKAYQIPEPKLFGFNKSLYFSTGNVVSMKNTIESEKNIMNNTRRYFSPLVQEYLS